MIILHSNHTKRSVFGMVYIAYLWGCRAIEPKPLFIAPLKLTILHKIRTLTENPNLQIVEPTEGSSGPAFFYDGKAWDIMISNVEFRKVAKIFYPEEAEHECSAPQGVVIFFFKTRELTPIAKFDYALHKFLVSV